MSLAVANNSVLLRSIPTDFRFDNGNKPILSTPNKASFIVPKILPRKNNIVFKINEFDYKSELKLVEMVWNKNSPMIEFKLKLIEDVFVKLRLEGEWKGKNELQFYLRVVK